MKKYEINGKEYELIKDEHNCFDLEEVKSFMTEYFDNFDYVLGDFAYDRLRLKGFKDKGNKINNIKNLDTYIKDFWKEHEKKMKDWYQKQKKETDVIISASPEFLLKPLEKKYHFTVIATKVNKKTGLFESKNCHDVEKIRRYEEQFHKKIKEFYTDSIKADKPMLEYAKVGYVVTKDKIEKYEGE